MPKIYNIMDMNTPEYNGQTNLLCGLMDLIIPTILFLMR